ncbi:hypothetical protein [Lysobacter enzymogenes]|uniref:hypothetical protein n=1 Tax=Lysobacter enzymogenes TaxID=69 RepID=UPI001A95BCB1|nr:hypothetical protein [Lysobacter enzymogenes]QQP96237.1 hypothetical protein JHW38_24035 [Lysobacter enzymogenes]
MTSIPAPYAVSADPAARRWWDGLSEQSRRALKRSWRDDGRPDPLHATARRTAAFLNTSLVEREDAELAWEPLDFYEYLMGHFPEPRLWPRYIGGIGPSRWLVDGIFWPVKYGQVDRAACSLEQHALLSMHEGNA